MGKMHILMRRMNILQRIYISAISIHSLPYFPVGWGQFLTPIYQNFGQNQNFSGSAGKNLGKIRDFRAVTKNCWEKNFLCVESEH